MRKKIACGLLVALGGVWAAGCNSSAPSPPLASNSQAARSSGVEESFDGTLREVRVFTDELLKKIESAPDASAGLSEAQKLLDTRRGDLRAKIVAARASVKAKESAEARARLLESEVDNTARLSGLQTKYLDNSMSDAGFKAKLDRLVGDYQELFKE